MDNSVLIGIVLIGALFGAGLYEAVVMAPNYAFGVPESLEQAKRFMGASNPGNFFRVIAPLTPITLLITLILNWRGPDGRRWWILSALILAVLTDVITFTFHYPRNAVLFTDPMSTRPDLLAATIAEWTYGNYVRVCLLLAGTICAIKAGMSRATREAGE